ncbi:MAG: 30S ribosomal protein S20 [Clostridia bacterium]|nr:30S ribosomal protein S20 [Clostridia bacterium]
MPIIKSQKKRVLISAEEKARNNSVRSEVKTAVKKFEIAIAENKLDEAAELLKKAVSAIDEAKRKGVYHINTVSRKKARLSKMLDQAVKAGKAE